MLRRPVDFAQYTSLAFTDELRHEKSTDRMWSGRAEVEKATASWVHWFNTSRLHTSIGDVPPVEYEDAHRGLLQAQPTGYSHTAVA